MFRDFCEMAYCAAGQALPGHRNGNEVYETRYMLAIEPYGSREELDRFCSKCSKVTRVGRRRLPRTYAGLGLRDARGCCDPRYGPSSSRPDPIVAEIPGARHCRPSTAQDGGLYPGGYPVRAMLRVRADDPRGLPGVSRRLSLGDGSVKQHGCGSRQTRLTTQVCAQMTYIQMALAGVPGVVRRANTMSMEMFDWAVTPAGALLFADSEFLRDKLATEVVEPSTPAESAPLQGKLF